MFFQKAKFKLSDGADIYLTECYFFDTHKQKYANGLSLDVETENSFKEAKNWLNNLN